MFSKTANENLPRFSSNWILRFCAARKSNAKSLVALFDLIFQSFGAKRVHIGPKTIR